MVYSPTILKHKLNILDRQYYIEKVNAPLFKAGIILGNRYPEPTFDEELPPDSKKANVLNHNSKVLVGIYRKYLTLEGNGRVLQVVMALVRIIINKIEHSPTYRDRFYWFVEELRKSDWKPRALNHPEYDWNEPKPYGGN